MAGVEKPTQAQRRALRARGPVDGVYGVDSADAGAHVLRCCVPERPTQGQVAPARSGGGLRDRTPVGTPLLSLASLPRRSALAMREVDR